MHNSSNTNECLNPWLARGVKMPHPASVAIDPDIPLEAIAPGTILHAGTRLRGKETRIGPDCELGREAPVTIENCQLGANVKLKGGYFADAVFLDGAAMGSCAHVRGGTLLEEGAELAHAAGLKQTIFFPFVVGGSLINFCDAFMSGGTDRKHHSEIGSSYIHFNFTPHGDKATASLIGDVPRGVMLDQPPVFLGGQGGMAGPVRIAFGTVIAAGSVLRQNVLEPNQLIVPPALPVGGIQKPYNTGYHAITRTVENGLLYFANIVALKAWYLHVRRPLMTQNAYSAACYEGALRQLDVVLDERLKRLDAVLKGVAQQDDSALVESLRAEHQTHLAAWPAQKEKLEAAKTTIPAIGEAARDAFLQEWNTLTEADYIARIKALSPAAKEAGTQWLDGIVSAIAGNA